MEIKPWIELSNLTHDEAFTIERVRLTRTGIGIEGRFELPPLSRLSYEDQVFIGTFVRTHGSIKEMERAFGVSYPTIKGRLNAISEKLGSLGVEVSVSHPVEKSEVTESVLAKLERGEITAAQAVEMLKK